MRLLKFLTVLACGLALAGFAPIVAFAASTADPSTTVDVSPFLLDVANLMMAIVLPSLVSLILYAVYLVAGWLGVKRTSERDREIRAKVDQALDWAVRFGMSRIGSNQLTVDLRDAIIADAAGYAMRSIPATLKKIGIVDEASERLAEMVEARLGLPAPSPAL